MFLAAKQPPSANRCSRAFTLVELLVAIVIMGILGSMVTVALSGAKRQAQDTRAIALIDRLNLVILELYEQEANRLVSAPVSTPQPSPAPPPNDPNSQALKTRSLAMLNWKRDYLRCSLPDRIQDLVDPPIDVYYYLYRGRPPGPPGPQIVLARMDPAFNPPVPPPLIAPLPWTTVRSASLRWQVQERYRQRVLSIVQATAATAPASWNECVDGSAANGEWTAENQSAECLYLIMSSHMINGTPAIESLRTRDIGDLDKDGVPEVLDPWGVPVGYLRWPCGLSLVPDWGQAPSSNTELAARKIELSKDTLDILYSDPRYDDTTSTDYQADDPFNLLPMVVSAGSDGVFDMVGLDSPPMPTISYAIGVYPINPSGTLGFSGTPRFIDPYQYGVQPIDQLGARKDTTDSGTDNSADNIYPSFDFS